MEKPFVAVVTGSSSGIGRAIAIEFAKRDACVVVHGCRNLQGLEHTVRCIQSHKQTPAPECVPLALVADIQDRDSSRSMVNAVFDRVGYVDVWVHAAGADVLTGESRSLSFSEKLRRLWEIDVHGTMMLSRIVAARMLSSISMGTSERMPSMVHIGWDQSESGMEGDSGQYFAATKAAITAFSKSLAKSLAPHIRVNCVAPGWIQTEWGAHASEGWQQRATGESMLQRWGTPEDIARVVAAVSLQDGAFINGQTIAVNGGWQSMALSAKSESNLNQ